MQLTLVYYISITIDKEIIEKLLNCIKKIQDGSRKKWFSLHNFLTINIFDLVKEQNNFSMFF